MNESEIPLREREKPEKQATICFILDRKKGQVLLAMKKKGFGVNKYNGYGGKPDPNKDKTIKETATRELEEESGLIVDVSKLMKVGEIDFYFPESKKQYNQTAHIYIIEECIGVPIETEEMKPEWFDLDKIPYDKMWDTDQHWMPHILAGQKIFGRFLFCYVDDQEITKEFFVEPTNIN
jgi:8-oxo-dGTP pyrophosphatase MutT (NUDIX family)